MPHLYRTPDPDLDDDRVLGEIHAMRSALASVLRVPRRWTGGLRRSAQAQAIRGSNSIEGYVVSEQDALAAVDDDEPLSADQRTWAEVVGYRRVLTYVIQLASTPGFRVDTMTLRSMHFMLLEHDLGKSPGQYRRGAVDVQDEATGETVYEAPDSDDVPALVDALGEGLEANRGADPLVRGAMAHLDLVMIHPFRDGNGRMARALQTLVLAEDAVLEPSFASIEEWLGRNTEDYYRVLAATGQGAWRPERDAHLWVKFCLRAHHMQAQTQTRRFREAEEAWTTIDRLVGEHALPERTADLLFDAVRGVRVRRPSYARRADLEDRTATRDLGRLVDVGLLEPRGQTRGRYYRATQQLMDPFLAVRSRRGPLQDPFPDLMDEIRRASPPVTDARTV
ncbi:Fic family protein [Pseudokineococcus sp. 1T1Z-3]|uniref:Fic family protein n=1 Tax=Pseudokineococcus sp. 1T1Z-3 TaxID=3132745 RepID=UPI00309D89B7